MKLKIISIVMAMIMLSPMAQAVIMKVETLTKADNLVEMLKKDEQFCEKGNFFEGRETIRSLAGTRYCSKPLGAALAFLACSHGRITDEKDFGDTDCYKQAVSLINDKKIGGEMKRATGNNAMDFLSNQIQSNGLQICTFINKIPKVGAACTQIINAKMPVTEGGAISKQ